MFSKTTPAQIYGDIFFFCGLIGGCGARMVVFVSHTVLGKSTYYFS